MIEQIWNTCEKQRARMINQLHRRGIKQKFNIRPKLNSSPWTGMNIGPIIRTKIAQNNQIDHHNAHHRLTIPLVHTENPCCAPPCPYSNSFHRFSVASTINGCSVWKKCSKLVLGLARVGSGKGLFGIRRVWKYGERMRNVSEVTHVGGNRSTKQRD